MRGWNLVEVTLCEHGNDRWHRYLDCDHDPAIKVHDLSSADSDCGYAYCQEAARRTLGDCEKRWWCRNPRPEKCINERSRQFGLRISERDPGLGVDHSECGFVYVVPAQLPQ